jgi:hypothetical protein
VQNSDVMKQNESAMQIPLEVIPTIAHFVFQVYADRSTLKMDQEFVEAIFDFMPWPPAVQCQEIILGLLAKCMLMPALATQWFRMRVCVVLAEFVVLVPEELAKFRFDPNLVKKCQFILKRVLVTSPELNQGVSQRLTNPSDRPLLVKFLQ